jgi:hypothetical protein
MCGNLALLQLNCPKLLLCCRYSHHSFGWASKSWSRAASSAAALTDSGHDCQSYLPPIASTPTHASSIHASSIHHCSSSISRGGGHMLPLPKTVKLPSVISLPPPQNGNPTRSQVAISSTQIKKMYHERAIRAMVRDEFCKCLTTADIFQVAVVVVRHPLARRMLGGQSEFIVRAFFRCRKTSSDRAIAYKIFGLIRFFDKWKVKVNEHLLSHGLRFAMRSRDLQAVKIFLREFHLRGIPMTRYNWRRAIAKCSIGEARLGEIRNGRWDMNVLRQVLFGFDHAEPGMDYHLAAYLDRSEWQQLRPWLQIIAHYGFLEDLMEEYRLWMTSDTRLLSLEKPGPGHASRVDRCFVESFAKVGDFAFAWTVMRETALPPTDLIPCVWRNLQEHLVLNGSQMDQSLIIESKLGSEAHFEPKHSTTA